MTTAGNSNNVDSRNRNNPLRSWDAFERLFEEAFSRSKSRSLSPDVSSPLSTHFPDTRAYTHAGATPYASGSPEFVSSDESLGFSGPEELAYQDDPFDTIWDEGLRRTRRSTVTASRNVKRPKHELDSSGSNSTSTSASNDSSNSPPPDSPPSPPMLPTTALPSQSVKPQKVRKRKSKVFFKDSSDGKTVTATFELPGINKSDVHVSYQNDKVVISWESVTTDEKMEGDRLIRERKEKKYVRTLPLPDGTKFEEVKASMDGRHLVLTYPKFTTQRPIQVIEIKTGR